jgi:hypothetical protein
MAKRTSRGGRAAKGGAAGRQTKSKKAAVAVTEVKVVEEKPGIGIDGGIAVMTTVLLLAAILFVDYHLGTYDAGLFF